MVTNKTSKKWYESMTIRNSIYSIIAMLGVVGAAFGFDFNVDIFKGSIEQIFAGIGGAIAIYTNVRAIIGRRRAKETIE